MINPNLRFLYGPTYGAMILDRYMPGWWRKLHLDKLDMESTTNCIAGQLFKHLTGWDGFSWFLMRSPVDDGRSSGWTSDARFGFTTNVDTYYSYDELEEAWRDLIIERLQADRA